jgi:molybdate transport system substrate-binding protein
MLRLSAAVLGVVLVAAQLPPRPEITVSAAVSLTEALAAAGEAYSRAGGGAIRFNFGASNVLARQIVNGAPVDVFVSADEAQMDVVEAAGMLVHGSRVDLLSNQLAVVVPDDRPRTFSSINDLADPAFRRIAIGDPAGVPAGVYARQYLQQAGLWPAVASRIVPAASVRGALSAVESGAADAAIVYHTDARTATHATIAWLVPLDAGPAIRYPAAVVRTSRVAAEAQRFLDFLRSTPGARVFRQFGFSTPR